MKKLRWGILGCAKIAKEHLIPAIQKSQSSEVVAVASRSLEKATAFAEQLHIPRAYDGYEALLNDTDVDVVYNPMPNHQHVPWTIRAIEAGKHVLCEKPIALSAKDLFPLLAVVEKHPQIKVMEAFMYRFHPQWARAKTLIDEGLLGTIKMADTVFTYNSFDLGNVRYQKDIGGGSLLDVGCYCISASRYLFGREPIRGVGVLDIEPQTHVDRHVSGMLDFGSGVARFTSSMGVECTQGVTVLGEKGRMIIESPFFLPAGKVSRVIISSDGNEEVFTYDDMNHYLLQVDALASAIESNKAVPTPLSDALHNMRAIDAIFKSHEIGSWVSI